MPTRNWPEPGLGFVLNDVARLLRRNFNRRVQGLGLTQAQWQALIYISRNPGMTQSRLAEILEVQPISVARLIRRMEAAGWVRRCPDPSDRRAVNLHLTEKTEPILEKMQEHAAELRAQAFAGIDEEDLQTMMQNLLVMRANLADDVN